MDYDENNEVYRFTPMFEKRMRMGILNGAFHEKTSERDISMCCGYRSRAFFGVGLAGSFHVSLRIAVPMAGFVCL